MSRKTRGAEVHQRGSTRQSLRVIWTGLMAYAACGGCGPASNRPPVAPVSGRIVYNGDPLAEAQVLFYPTEKGKPVGGGITDDNGDFQLTTYVKFDGAVVGAHLIAVQKRATPNSDRKPPPAHYGAAALEELEEAHLASGPPEIPIQYFQPDTSGLAADVLPHQRNWFEFELSDDSL